jgi:hypothetical protein
MENQGYPILARFFFFFVVMSLMIIVPMRYKREGWMLSFYSVMAKSIRNIEKKRRLRICIHIILEIEQKKGRKYLLYVNRRKTRICSTSR